MRFADRRPAGGALGFVLLLLLACQSPRAEPLGLFHDQRYCMGTMFDIVVYHRSRAAAERAISMAMDEIVRLDGVMSHFKDDSDLSRLVRSARSGFVAVDPSLYEVIEESIGFSERSGGKFDITIAPLLRTWQRARAEGRRPSAADVADAKRCVGYEKIERQSPRRIRFRSDCVEIDLGGIGKGYAVDRAVAVLRSAGVLHAVVNAGRSSIAAIGAPPGKDGWPVSLGPDGGVVLLRNNSISTSQQNLEPLHADGGVFGEILDPLAGAPAENRMAVSVVAPRATVSDALDTTLVLLSMEESRKLLAQFAGVSAYWIAPDGSVKATYSE
jgi:FAD:protein FMN transferase